MIYNVKHDTFGTLGIRNGDLLAIANVIEYLRKTQNKQIKFFIEPGVIVNNIYNYQFYEILNSLTDYFSLVPGEKDLSYKNIHLWDYRAIIGDHVKIANPKSTKKKITIFPLYDAEYNQQRNWTVEFFNSLLEQYSTEQYSNYEKIVCCKDYLPFDLKQFQISTDFKTNIYHILDSEIFIGGDTGVSHFVSVLDNGPKELIYYYSARCLIHTIPFYCFEGRGKLKTFWQNFENSVLE